MHMFIIHSYDNIWNLITNYFINVNKNFVVEKLFYLQIVITVSNMIKNNYFPVLLT